MKGHVNPPFRILLFDDNSLVRSLLGKLLLNQGWEVFSFPEPEACPLHHSAGCTCNLPEICADAIVTDLAMPGMDGCTFVLELLKKGCRIQHVAILTDNQDTALLAKARASGVAVFNKVDGFNPVLDWLKEIEARSVSQRQLTQWVGVSAAKDGPRPETSGNTGMQVPNLLPPKIE
jgi:CheY-like chemotaxis protein